jgi:transposase
VAAARTGWRAEQPTFDAGKLVFIDETWAKTNMARRRGRCRRGLRLVAKVPHGHWKTMTFLAALRHDGVTAPFVINGPIDGDSFKTYVTHCLAPTLAPGDIVVMDNLGSHKSPEIRAAIEAKGATLRYLPPYSPDLNPIELMFAKLKAILRKAAERTLTALWKRIGASLNAFTPQECANYFIADGYNPT